MATIIVLHKNTDLSNTYKIIKEKTFSVEPGEYGPYQMLTKDDFAYDYVWLADDSAPASGVIATGETKTITYLYGHTISVDSVFKSTWHIQQLRLIEGNHHPSKRNVHRNKRVLRLLRAGKD